MAQNVLQNTQFLPFQTADNFDPTRDIDISSIESEIIDTSRGDIIDYEELAFNTVYRLKCMECGFVYEGKIFVEKCPICGSNKLDDTDNIDSI